MTFVLLMAAREFRASWRRLLFFFVCVAIGVGAIVALRSIIQSVRGGLMGEARAMIAADAVIQSNRAWTSDVREALETRIAKAPVVARQDSIELATMVRPERGAAVARMVELRGVEPGFPFYGRFVLQGGVPYSHDLLRGHGALVRPELLAQLGIGVGDRIMIGGKPFTVRGVIEQEPGGSAGGFSLGSRVLVDLADLRATGLLTFGSRASYQILLKMDEEGALRLVRDVRDTFRERFVTARSFRSTENQIGDSLERAENFLSLVGFIIVVLGGIGVWSVTRVFVQQKVPSVAILKCLGASTRQVLAAYVAQVALLALAGSLLGVGLAAVGIRCIPASLTAAFRTVPYGLTLSAVLQGLAVGLLVSLLFALVPLLEVRRVKPLLLLRGFDLGATGQPREATFVRRVRSRLAAIDRLQATTGVLVAMALVVVASWQAGSWRAGAAVTIGFAGVAAVLYGVAFVLVRVVSPLASAHWFPLRHAVVSLRRPGNQTRVILLAVGLGSFFVLGVRSLQNDLIAEFALALDPKGADMFLIDVQRDQVEGVRALLVDRQDAGSPPPRLVPVLRARVTGVKGREVTLESFSEVRGRGSLGREYGITYRNALEQNERVTAGRFWTGQPPLAPEAPLQEVSIEQSIHERFGIAVGDVMRFDVLGRTIQARVTSVRRVEWADARSGGFMFVFRPGALEQAPQTFVGFAKGPADLTARARLQYDLVAKYPNVTAVDGREVLGKIQTVLDNAVLAISIVGGIALLSGTLILIGAVAMTKYQRVYEAAILRTLGASTRTLGTMLAIEYCALGLLAGTIGAAGAAALTWGVTRHVLDITWRPAPLLLVSGAMLTTALVAAVGVAASADVLRKKPLGALRAE